MKTCSKCKEEKVLEGFTKDKRYKDGLYPHCNVCLERNYQNLEGKVRTCNTCKVEQPLVDFPKTFKSATGFDKKCKKCTSKVESKRKAKSGQVSEEEVSKYRAKLTEDGAKFTCKCCGKIAGNEDFYHKRDYGRVYIVQSRCKECEKFYQIERTFKVTKQQYQDTMAKQDNCCAICRIDIEDYKKQGYRDYFAVDHCHETGKVRGLLCDACNRGLGFFKDKVENLYQAVNYLNLHRS